MIVWAWLSVTLLLVFSKVSAATPSCENSMHPLPALASCLHLIGAIYGESKDHPFLYHWSHNPSGFDEKQLPKTWIDGPSHYTYSCAVTVDLIKGHEKDGDSFSIKDVSTIANNIVNECLLPAHGIRPQIGYESIGFFHRPKIVRVHLYSVRLGNEATSNRTSSIYSGNSTGLVEVS